MSENAFLDIAIRSLPGGLILVDLQGRIRAVNDTAISILGLPGPVTAGITCDKALAAHPKIAGLLTAACRAPEAMNRQEMTTDRPDGEKIVLGYGLIVLKDADNQPVGIGLTFQDITRLIPLMDSHRFLDIALKNLPGGLIFVDLQGKIRGVNQMAQRILGLTGDIEPGSECHKALADHPQVVKVLLSTTQSLNAANRQELTTRNASGEKISLGYGTLILRNAQGGPVGVGLTFQDITRFIPLPLQTEFIRLVDRFFTPFAATMVLAAMWLGFAEPRDKYIALGLVTTLVLFNEASVWFARRRTDLTKSIGAARLVTNFLFTIVLVYLLGTFWGPMWLMFVLTPVATALYADWKKTLGVGALSAAALLGIYAARGLEGSVGWGQASLHAAFIVFISSFVNSIARMVMQIKSAGPTSVRPAATPPTVNAKPVTQDQKLAA